MAKYSVYTDYDYRGNRVNNADLSARWDPSLPEGGGVKPPVSRWTVSGSNPTTQSSDVTNDYHYNSTTGSIWQVNASGAWADTGVSIRTTPDVTLDPTGGITSGTQGLKLVASYFDTHFIVKDGAAAQTLASSITFTGAVSVPSPTTSAHATTKAYVDALASGVRPLAAVRVAATTNVADLTNPGQLDGVTLALNDRVLLAFQTDKKQNGLYIRNAAGALVRSADANTNGSIKVGSQVFVAAGNTQANSSFAVSLVAPDPFVPGTSETTWVLASQITGYTAGSGLTLAGTLFSAQASATGGLAVSPGGIAIKLAPGSGLTTTAAGLAVDLPAATTSSRVFATTVTYQAGTTLYNVTHPLSSVAVDVTVLLANKPVGVSWEATSPTSIALTIMGATAGNVFTVAVMG